jgi:hypothetical protein
MMLMVFEISFNTETGIGNQYINIFKSFRASPPSVRLIKTNEIESADISLRGAIQFPPYSQANGGHA